MKMTLIERLRKVKEERGYTNAMIAEMSGVPLGTVQKIMSGETRIPRWNTQLALSSVLWGESIDNMVRREEEARRNDRYLWNSAGEDAGQGVPHMVCEGAVAYAADAPVRRDGAYTLEDYYALPDDRRVELIDGRFYDMAAPSDLHQALLGRIYAALLPCADAHPECELFVAPTDVRLDFDNRTMVQPDILAICNRQDTDHRRINGAPDFVIEVTSPSSRRHDMIRKLYKYSMAGVREYWVVDPDYQVVHVYLPEEDRLEQTYTFDDTVPVRISNGECSVDFSYIRDKVRRYLPEKPDESA